VQVMPLPVTAWPEVWNAQENRYRKPAWLPAQIVLDLHYALLHWYVTFSRALFWRWSMWCVLRALTFCQAWNLVFSSSHRKSHDSGSQETQCFILMRC
jgi:hypothetical protein